MARIARQYGRVLIYILPLLAIAAFFALRPHQAEGGTPYSDPFWTHTSSYPECSACSSCGCPSAPEFTQEGVSARTGELVVDFLGRCTVSLDIGLRTGENRCPWERRQARAA